MRLVKIETQAFEAEAIYYKDLPVKMLTEIPFDAEPIKRINAWVNLMTKVILDPALAAAFESLSFDEAMKVCSAYLRTEPYQMKIEERLGGPAWTI